MAESSGEDFLREQGLIKRSSHQRQQLLGCLGCRWSKAEADGKSPTAYGFQVIKCTGIQAGVIYPLLQKLEDAGVTESEWEDIKPGEEGRPARRCISPADTRMGQAFKASLTPPAECPLETQANPDFENQS